MLVRDKSENEVGRGRSCRPRDCSDVSLPPIRPGGTDLPRCQAAAEDATSENCFVDDACRTAYMNTSRTWYTWRIRAFLHLAKKACLLSPNQAEDSLANPPRPPPFPPLAAAVDDHPLDVFTQSAFLLVRAPETRRLLGMRRVSGWMYAVRQHVGLATKKRGHLLPDKRERAVLEEGRSCAHRRYGCVSFTASVCHYPVLAARHGVERHILGAISRYASGNLGRSP
ncbi:hypothetical protein MRX96_037317 [Rhipicephalus microplus]